jgi:hypothetical protein
MGRRITGSACSLAVETSWAVVMAAASLMINRRLDDG